MRSEDMKKLEELYRKTRLDYFVMAISHLMHIGWGTAEEITDEQIENCEGNGFMTKEFVMELNRTAREIARSCEPSGLICFCEYKGIFDTGSYFEDAREKTVEKAIEAIRDLNDEYELDNELDYKLERYLAKVEGK